MDQRIIYKREDGGCAVIIPDPNCGLTVEQIALKDVPFGKPFKIVAASDISANYMERNDLVADATSLNDGIGADYGVGSINPFAIIGAKL